MKRRLRQTAGILLLLLLAAAVLRPDHRPAAAPAVERPEPPVPGRVRSVFALDPDRWTTFRLPPLAQSIRIGSRAVLDLPVPGEPGLDEGVPYTIAYHVESISGRDVASGELALSARVTPKVDGDGAPAQEAWIIRDAGTVANLRASILDVDASEVLLVKLKVVALEPPVRQTVVRVAYRQQVPERKLGYLWSRLSPASRDRLLATRLLGSVDLDPAEQRRLLEHRWSPVGPQGVEGRDYRQVALHLRDDLEPLRRPLIEPLAVGERRCGPGQHLVLGLPAPGGDLDLRFRYLATPEPVELILRWYGESIHERAEHRVTISPDRPEARLPVGPGMLEFIAPVPLTVMPWLTGEGGPATLLAHEATQVRAWICDPEAGLRFVLAPNAAGHVRLVGRPAGADPVALTLGWRDGSGEILQTNRATLVPTPSLYDRLLTPEGDAPVAEPVETICRIPAGAVHLEVGTEGPALLAAYIRPAALKHRTRVPADYLRALPDPVRQPVWFGWRPEDADTLLRNHRSALIHLQTRPPEDDADILAGKYRWEDFQPAAGGLGHLVLTERNPEAPSREEALPGLFMPLPGGREVEVPWAAPAGVERPSRRLIYLRDGEQPAALQIFIDGVLHLERNLVTARGELPMLPVPPGSRTLRWTCSDPGLSLYLNYVDPAQATTLKRLAQRLPPRETLEYRIEKIRPDEELLTGTYFAPAGSTGTVELVMSLVPELDGGFLDLSDTHTPLQRVYLLEPDGSGVTPVLGGSGATFDRGRRFFIPLGKDVKPGAYRLQLTQGDGAEAYLTLSRIIGGDYADARFFREGSR